MLDPRTPEGVAHVARLARIELSPGEAAEFAGDLSRVLDAARALEALDRDPPAGGPAAGESGAGEPGDLPWAEPVALSGLRADEVEPSLDQAAALRGAPAQAGGGFAVPPVLAVE